MALPMDGYQFTTTNLDGKEVVSTLEFTDQRTDKLGRRAYTLTWVCPSTGKNRAQCFFAVPPPRPS